MMLPMKKVLHKLQGNITLITLTSKEVNIIDLPRDEYEVIVPSEAH